MPDGGVDVDDYVFEITDPNKIRTVYTELNNSLVDLLVNGFNFKGKVIFDNTKPDGQFRKHSDNSKLKSYLPDFKFTPIEQGIKETISWFLKNYENARKALEMEVTKAHEELEILREKGASFDELHRKYK